MLQNLFHRRPIEKEIIKTFPRYTEFHLRYLLCPHLKRNLLRVVHKYAVSPARKIKRDILIGLVCTCSAVLVPDIYALPVFDKWREPFSKTIDQFSHR